MLTRYDDGMCFHSNEGSAFTLYTSGVLEVQEFDASGVYEQANVKLPDWLAEAIRKAFVEEIESNMNRGA